VGQLVSDNGADCSEIRAVIRLSIEQRRLQDGGGESNRSECCVVEGDDHTAIVRSAPSASLYQETREPSLTIVVRRGARLKQDD
jgi:hypothetical protein